MGTNWRGIFPAKFSERRNEVPWDGGAVYCLVGLHRFDEVLRVGVEFLLACAGGDAGAA